MAKGKFSSDITVLVDNREKKPLLFPKGFDWSPGYGWPCTQIKLKSQSIKMDAGDYSLLGFEDVSIIERKASFRELFTNLLTKDRVRQLKSFEKLDLACRHAYILLEGSPSTMWRQAQALPEGRGRVSDPGIVIDRLWELVVKHNFGVVWSGGGATHSARRILGEIVVRILLRHAYDSWKEK